MLFKFKSKACADLIMLEADGRRILKAMIGNDPVKGIVRASDLASALARLETAVAEDEAMRQDRDRREHDRRALATSARDEEEATWPTIGLAQRAAPMQQMLRRCMAEQADLVWGV